MIRRPTHTDAAPAHAARPRVPWWAALAAGFAHAALMVAAFAPVGLWPCALLAPAPLVWLALRSPRPGRSGLWAALGASPFWAFEQFWIASVSLAGFPPLVVYLSAHQWLFVWLVGRGARAWTRMAAPWAAAAWVGVEFFRGAIAWHGYPWYLVSHPLIDAPLGPRVASVVGAYGASWLVAGVGCAIGAWWAARLSADRRSAWGIPGAQGAAAVLLWSCAAFVPPVPTGETYRVAVVQTNVPQSVRGTWDPLQRLTDLDRFIELTAAAAAAGPDLIVWPETIFPGDTLAEADAAEERTARIVWREPFRRDAPTWKRIVWHGPGGEDDPVPVERAIAAGEWLVVPSMAARDTLLHWHGRFGVPMLIGSDGYDGLRIDADERGVSVEFEARYNSAYVLADGRVLPQRYDKLHLTPFGEVMPYISAWPWLERTMLRIGVGAGGMHFDFSAGRGPVVLHAPSARDPDAPPVRLATPICFEATMPRVCRRLVSERGERRADLMVQLTNEGWFGGSVATREQHLQIARWRCAELGTPMVRAANTGISAAIDAHGRVIDEGVPAGLVNTDGVLVTDVALPAGSTLYARVGDAPGWLALWLTLLGLAGTFAPRAIFRRGEDRSADNQSGDGGRRTRRPAQANHHDTGHSSAPSSSAHHPEKKQ